MLVKTVIKLRNYFYIAKSFRQNLLEKKQRKIYNSKKKAFYAKFSNVKSLVKKMKEHNGKIFIEGKKHDLSELLEVVSILRSEKGCEWDRAQTHQTLKKCLIDESQEVISAIDKCDDQNLCEELGDLLLQVLMNAQIAKERGVFDFEKIVQGLTDKLIRRHPHVFGDEQRPTTPEQSLALWKKVKEIEKQRKSERSKND